MGPRYYSVALMDMFTNNNVVLGTRTVGGEGGTFTLVGPGQASIGPNPVRIATPHAWMLVRTLVNGPADVEAATQGSGWLRAERASRRTGCGVCRPRRQARRLFRPPPRLLASDPAPATDLKVLRRTSAFLGAGPFNDAAAADGVDEAKMITVFAKGRQVFTNGWSYPRPNLGDYGQDYIYRAIVALQGLGALPVAEAMYMKAAGDDGAGLFTGDGSYRLSLPPSCRWTASGRYRCTRRPPTASSSSPTIRLTATRSETARRA
jgi:hypothetical protein